LKKRKDKQSFSSIDKVKNAWFLGYSWNEYI
jgi:hypothetical protein